MSDKLDVPLTYEWLHEHGFRTLPRFDRQPTDHVRRCIGLETVEDSLFLRCSEELCLDLAPERMPEPRYWFCWVTRASSQHQHPPRMANHAQARADTDFKNKRANSWRNQLGYLFRYVENESLKTRSDHHD